MKLIMASYIAHKFFPKICTGILLIEPKNIAINFYECQTENEA